MTDEPREIQADPVVLEGDDHSPAQPAPPLDPYTPEPGARPGDRRAFRSLWLVFLVLALVSAAIVIWAVAR